MQHMLQILDESAIKRLKRYGFERNDSVNSEQVALMAIPTKSELALMLFKAHADAER